MRTIALQLFKFNELSGQAQKKAIYDYDNRGETYVVCDEEIEGDTTKEILEANDLDYTDSGETLYLIN